MQATLIPYAFHRRHHVPRLIEDTGQQVGAHRHRHLGRRARRRCAQIGGEVDQRGVGLVPHRRDQRDLRRGGGAHHLLLVEGPEILQAAAATGDDEDIGPGHAAAGCQLVEAPDGGRDLVGRALALHLHRPQDDPAREAVVEPVQDVADHGTRGRGDDTDHIGQERQFLLARLVEQAFLGELAAAVLQELQERALAGEFHRLDHDLVARAAGVGRDAAGAHDLHALLQGQPEAADVAAPAHAVEHRVRVLEGEVEMAGGMVVGARHLAPHADPLEGPFKGVADRAGDLGHRVFGDVVRAGRRGRRGALGIAGHGEPHSMLNRRTGSTEGTARKREAA